jgi:hypothetical protein
MTETAVADRIGADLAAVETFDRAQRGRARVEGTTQQWLAVRSILVWGVDENGCHAARLRADVGLAGTLYDADLAGVDLPPQLTRHDREPA